jgi:hypothetical protein
MGHRLRSVCDDSEIISIGERAHEAFSECAVLVEARAGHFVECFLYGG